MSKQNLSAIIFLAVVAAIFIWATYEPREVKQEPSEWAKGAAKCKQHYEGNKEMAALCTLATVGR